MFPIDEEKFEKLLTELQTLCQEHRLTIASAESCTGGLIGALLSHQSGSSGHFLGGFIPYSNVLKVELLGIPREMIEKHGAVSSEVALTMARQARKLTHASYALAVTGIAGPTGGTEEKPVGTVWFAWSSATDELSTISHFIGSREDVRVQTALHAIQELLVLIRKKL